MQRSVLGRARSATPLRRKPALVAGTGAQAAAAAGGIAAPELCPPLRRRCDLAKLVPVCPRPSLRRPLSVRASAGNGSGGNGSGGNGSSIDGSLSTSVSSKPASTPTPEPSSPLLSSVDLPVPPPVPLANMRVEADLGVGEFDAFKEKSREYRRTYFDFAKWKSHRASSRYRRHIAGLFGSRIVRALGGPLAFVVVAAVVTGLYESARDAGVLAPSLFPSIAVGASGAAQVSGFALSLLLASRTTNSYARWLEAANLVGAVGAAATNFVRQSYTWIPDDDDEEEEEEGDGVGGEGDSENDRKRRKNNPSGRELRKAAARWAAVLPRALAARVREDVDLDDAAARVLLDERERLALARAPDAPRFVLAVMSAIAASAPAARVSVPRGTAAAAMMGNSATSSTSFDAGFRVSMDDGLTAASSAIAGCERLLRLPIPLSYTRHTSRVLVIALAFLPATLWRDCGWGCVPASALVSFLLLGIEEIGVAIEEPFSILPLEAMWNDVDAEIRGLASASAAARAMMRGWGSGGDGGGGGGGGDEVEEKEEETKPSSPSSSSSSSSSSSPSSSPSSSSSSSPSSSPPSPPREPAGAR